METNNQHEEEDVIHIKRMAIKEFRMLGFLQEVNRKFFHPLGLALEVNVDEDGIETLSSIWDYRDDSVGMFYKQNVINKDKIDYVEELRKSKLTQRLNCIDTDENGIQEYDSNENNEVIFGSKWSEEETEYLRKLATIYEKAKTWEEIARKVNAKFDNNRSINACCKKYWKSN